MKTEKTDVEPLAPAVCSADFPSLAQAMGYAAWLESAHDCFADRAAIVLYREMLRLRASLGAIHCHCRLRIDDFTFPAERPLFNSIISECEERIPELVSLEPNDQNQALTR